jgi:hypothetical protein
MIGFTGFLISNVKSIDNDKVRGGVKTGRIVSVSIIMWEDGIP